MMHISTLYFLEGTKELQLMQAVSIPIMPLKQYYISLPPYTVVFVLPT